MREIKFRAWNAPSKAMITNLDNLRDIGNRLNPLADYEFQQFTGLLDKNGKEIYEGDFLRFENLNYDPSEGDTPWLYEPVTWKLLAWGLGEYLLSDYDPKDIEVIGNIYENPELLTK